MTFPRVIAAVTAVAMTACAGVDPAFLQKVQDRDVLILSEDLVWSTKQDDMPARVHIPRRGGDYNHRLKAGEYVATYEDDQSRYYVGPENCLSNEITRLANGLPANWPEKVGHITTFRTCGLMLHKSGDRPARLFNVPSTATGRAATADTGERMRAELPAASGDPVTPVVVQQVINNPGPSVGAGVVGAALGGALVGAIIEAERNSLMEYPWLWNGLPRSLLKGRK